MSLFIRSITEFGILVIKIYGLPVSNCRTLPMISSELKCWYEEKVDLLS